MFRDALLPLFHRLPAWAHAPGGLPGDARDLASHRTTPAADDEEAEPAREATTQKAARSAPNATLARSCLTLGRIGAMRRRFGRR